METYYDILQVKPDATFVQIKKSFISLVSMYHPDIYHGDKDFAQKLTAQLTEAYTVLKNNDTRKAYDESLKLPKPNVIFQSHSKKFMRNDAPKKKKEKVFIHPREKFVRKENLEQREVKKLFRNNKLKIKSKKSILKNRLFYILLLVFGIEIVLLLLLIKN